MGTFNDLFTQVRRAVMAAALFSGIMAALLLLGPLVALRLIDDMSLQYNLVALAGLAALICGTILLVGLLDALRGEILLRAGVWLDHVLGQLMLEGGLKRAGTAADLEEDEQAVAQLRRFFTSSELPTLMDAMLVPLFIAGAFFVHPVMGGLLFTVSLVLTLRIVRNTRVGAGLLASTMAALHRRQAFARDALRDNRLTRALGLAGGISQSWEIANRPFVGGLYRLAKRDLTGRAWARGIALSTELAVPGLGAVLVVSGGLTPGALVASMMLAASALLPLRRAGEATGALQEARAAHKRLNALAHMPVLPECSSRVAGEEGDGIGLRNIAVTYEGRERSALRDITLELERGDSLAISGDSGSGKTTLVGVIAGAIEPSAGRASVDGLDPLQRARAGDSSFCGFAPDEPHLVTGTVHQNICRFEDWSLMSSANAAMKAGVHSLLSDLPEGYETDVGRGGCALSLREKRAVALARALHGSPAFVVLDTPEAGMSETEVKRLVEVLAALRREGTSLVIASNDPRLQSLCDRALLLVDGKIEAAGSSDEVLLLYREPVNRFEPWHDPSATLGSFREEL